MGRPIDKHLEKLCASTYLTFQPSPWIRDLHQPLNTNSSGRRHDEATVRLTENKKGWICAQSWEMHVWILLGCRVSVVVFPSTFDNSLSCYIKQKEWVGSIFHFKAETTPRSLCGVASFQHASSAFGLDFTYSTCVYLCGSKGVKSLTSILSPIRVMIYGRNLRAHVA